MKTQKSTKRALLLSVCSIMLCLAMLIGTTFAWFTDTASTGVNKIQSGTLKVDLQMQDENGKWVSAKDKTLEFVKAKGAEGETVLWEPGCTYELPTLRVVNDGNLALKYKIEITGITGDAELNEVIDWTMKVDDEDYALGVEHHLLPKTTDEGDTGYYDELTISGHMQESAGNDYMEKSIDDVAITVYAVQDAVESDSFDNQYDALADGTPQFDNWLANVTATGTVTAGKDLLLKDRETNPTVTAAIPAGSTAETTLTLTKSSAETPSNIEVVAGTDAVTANISLTDSDGNAVTAKAGKFFTLTLPLAKSLNVIGFYHNGEPVTKVDSAEAVAAANDTYYYDATTGVLTFSTDDFSPFTVVTSDSVFNGGNGSAEAPYLIATAEQALEMENVKGYFKLVNDVVITREIALYQKTTTLDLNGHTLKLEYAADAKATNGGALNVYGKKSNVTINDSSAAQTGKVIGSEQNISGKVTCAVRVGNYGKLTINGGHFYGMSDGTSCIYVYTNRTSSSKATVVINGGQFETASPYSGTYYVLNHEDGLTGGCTITVNGGSFKNYNPGVTSVDPANAYTGKIVLGTGCTTTSAEVDGATWYTVSK